MTNLPESPLEILVPVDRRESLDHTHVNVDSQWHGKGLRRKTSSSGGQGFDKGHFCPKGFPGVFQVIIRLKSEPESFRCSKESGQPQRRIGGDGPLPLHDLVYSPRRNVNVFRQSVLAHIHGFQKLFQKNFTGMNRWVISHFSSPFLVIVDNFHVMGIRIFPKKADAIFVVNPNAPLSFSGTLQGFQTVPRRNPKILEQACPMENSQFSFRNTGQFLRNFVGISSFKNFLGSPVLERSDHKEIVTRGVITVKENRFPLDTSPRSGADHGAGVLRDPGPEIRNRPGGFQEGRRRRDSMSGRDFPKDSRRIVLSRLRRTGELL